MKNSVLWWPNSTDIRDRIVENLFPIFIYTLHRLTDFCRSLVNSNEFHFKLPLSQFCLLLFTILLRKAEHNHRLFTWITERQPPPKRPYRFKLQSWKVVGLKYISTHIEVKVTILMVSIYICIFIRKFIRRMSWGEGDRGSSNFKKAHLTSTIVCSASLYLSNRNYGQVSFLDCIM